MAYRAEGFETGGVYHLLNRGVEQLVIFTDEQDYSRFISLLEFQRVPKSLGFSEAKRVARIRRAQFLEYSAAKHGSESPIVNVLCYCLMPNHFHLLVQQNVTGGISRYMQRLLNSYSRYFNARHKRTGTLFASQFRGIRVTTDNQLLHVSRYIHLNPVVARLCKDAFSYPWSSIYAYANTDGKAAQKILSVHIASDLLSGIMSAKEYEMFLRRHTTYAKELARIKHLLLEEGARIPTFTNFRSR
jgi:putative transposase